MSTDLSTTVRMMYRTNEYNNCWRGRRYRGWNVDHNNNVRYMEIPIHEDIFEVPLFAFSTFVNLVKKGLDSKASAIAVSLDTIEASTRYKTVDRYMRDVLLERYNDSRLVLLEAKVGNTTVTYYGTQGAVFNKDFMPIMICSYQLERRHVPAEEDGEWEDQYVFVRPILRVNPYTFLYKSDSMEKFIVNKMINTCLEDKIYLPSSYDLSEKFKVKSDEKAAVKVIIDNCPFLVHQTDSPSISTTNEKLLQLVIDHLDELIQ